MRAVKLGCEHREDAPCVDAAPRLSWALESGERDKRRSDYRIRVTGPAGTLWDSGRVQGSRTLDVPYAGRALPSGAECAWAVLVWDEAEEESARFRTGLLDGWTAAWIRRDRADDPGHSEPTEETDDGSEPELLRELHVEGADGVQVISGDGRRRASAAGAHQYADLLRGESYDARLELDGCEPARPAPRPARRRPGLPAHRDAQHGRRGVHDQVGRRRDRRPVGGRLVPGRGRDRPPSATAHRPGRTPA
jgi:hypothetical protein